MYTLRQVTDDSVFNISLGKRYLVINRFYHADSFRHYFKSHFGRDHVADSEPEADDNTKNVIAFVITDESIPIYQNHGDYYVMTSSGATFEVIHKRKNEKKV